MHKRMLLIFSHKLTDKQKDDAIRNYKVNEFLYMPNGLQKKWSQVPTDVVLKDYLKDLFFWILSNSEKYDYILVQGDFGATFMTVDFCFANDRIPIYSTTKRDIIEEKDDDESIIIKKSFSHERFRLYEKCR